MTQFWRFRMALVAAAQMNSNDSVEDNLEKVENYVSQASKLGAKLITLPENFAFMGKEEKDKFAIAEKLGMGPIQSKMSSLAKQYHIWIVGGTMPILEERQSSEEKYSFEETLSLKQVHHLEKEQRDFPSTKSQQENRRVYSTSWVWDHTGQAVAHYNKIHLFDVKVRPGIEEYSESKTVIPGEANHIVCVDSPIGKIGLSVCYDLRFPELYRKLLQKGAEILMIPSAFTVVTGQAHWEVLLRARAIENGCFVVAAAEVGQHPSGRITYGHSMIIDPWGKIMALEKEGEGLLMAEIDLAYLKDIRARLPMALHRKIQ